MNDTNEATRPAWIDQWIRAQSVPREYPEHAIACLRRTANESPEMRTTMLTFPPYCVIRFQDNEQDVYGIVMGVHMIELDKPKKGMPKRKVAIRHVPSPLHMAGATNPKESGTSYVFPEGVDVVAYVPGFTPEMMRALVCPAGSA